MKELLATKFIQEMGSQEMRPPIYNSSMLVHQSGWHTLKYFSRYYQNATPYPLFLIMDRKESLLYLPATKEKELVKEVFRKYWLDPSFLSTRRDEFDKFAKKIDQLIDSQFTYGQLATTPGNKVAQSLAEIEEVTWDMNASVFFSIYFDKQICEELIAEMSINISEENLLLLWEKATIIPGMSFEKRRQMYLWGLIAGGGLWSDIAEKCQYFDTAYDRVVPVSSIENKFVKEYGEIKREDVKRLIEEETAKVDTRIRDNDMWIATLSDEEQKLVIFLQFLIEIRDLRKDSIMKSVTGFYRVGEKMFRDAGIEDKNLILYVSVNELKKGVTYLKENIDLIKKRPDGISFIAYDDGRQELVYGSIAENKKLMTEFYEGQQTGYSSKGIELKGQPGSRGFAKGIVRIILDVEDGERRLKDGEILVTGMTRPEYVPLMKKAVAIVTDEGGITCHAAIVSRELNIPCVIGTKNATRVLKDGDLVEVDADKGVVRIIK